MPDKQTIDLLLQEFRAFRDNEFREFKDDVATWKQDAGERLAILENDVKSGIKGNGQPSRLATAEKRIEELQDIRADERIPEIEEKVDSLLQLRWKISGMAIAVFAVIDLAVKFLPAFLKKVFGAS